MGGGGGVRRAGLGLLKGFDVAFDARLGYATNLGDAASTLTLSGTATDEGTYVNVPTDVSGVRGTVPFSLDYDGGTGLLIDGGIFTAFVVVELGAITGSVAARTRLMGHKAGVGNTVAGFDLYNTSANLFQPRVSVGDGSAEGAHSTATEISNQGRVLVAMIGGWFFADLAMAKIVRCSDGAILHNGQTTITPADFTVGNAVMIWGAGQSAGGGAAGGVDGTRTLRLFGGGVGRKSDAVSDADWQLLAQYFSG